MKEKLYVLRTVTDGEYYYLKFLNAAGTFVEYSKELSEAQQHTAEEREYVKKFYHSPGLGRWVLLESEKNRARKPQEGRREANGRVGNTCLA